MIHAFALQAIVNGLLILILYLSILAYQQKSGIQGWKVKTELYPSHEQIFTIINIVSLTFIIIRSCVHIRSKVQKAHIQNYIENSDEKDINVMMLRTVEIQSNMK